MRLRLTKTESPAMDKTTKKGSDLFPALLLVRGVIFGNDSISFFFLFCYATIFAKIAIRGLLIPCFL